MSERDPTARSHPSIRCATRATSAIRQAELGLEYLMETALTETDESGDGGRCTNRHIVALGEAGSRLAVDRERRRAVTDHLDLHAFLRIEHERSIEQHVW